MKNCCLSMIPCIHISYPFQNQRIIPRPVCFHRLNFREGSVCLWDSFNSMRNGCICNQIILVRFPLTITQLQYLPPFFRRFIASFKLMYILSVLNLSKVVFCGLKDRSPARWKHLLTRFVYEFKSDVFTSLKMSFIVKWWFFDKSLTFFISISKLILFHFHNGSHKNLNYEKSITMVPWN